MNVRHSLVVFHSFSVKNIFYDKMDLRLFYFLTIALFLNCQLKTLEIFFIKVLLNPLLPNVPF